MGLASINFHYSFQKFLHSKSIVFFLIFYWLLTQIILYIIHGVKYVNDSYRFIEEANFIIDTGSLDAFHNFWYLGYILYLTLFIKLGINLDLTVLVQTIISGLAVVAFFKTVQRLADKPSAVLATFIFIFWFKIHAWNFYLLTESLFVSFTIFSFYSLVNINKKSNLIIFIPLVLFTFLIRPVGIALVVAIAAYIISRIWKYANAKTKFGLIIMIGSSALFFLFLANRMLETYNVIESYSTGEIIYAYKGVMVEVPDDLYIPDQHQPQLQRMIVFLFQNPIYFAKLTLMKLFFALGNVKPYFSFLHNLYIVLLLWPLYLFALKGAFVKSLNPHAKTFIITYVLMQTLIIIFTNEDWDGRFLIPLLPFIFILSAVGLMDFIRKKN